MERFPELCEYCFQDLYRTAVLITGEEMTASSLVEKTCVKGVHACRKMNDLRRIKTELTGILFELCNERTNSYRPGQRGYIEQLAELDSYERAVVIFRHCSGLRISELCMAIGAPNHHISTILSKARAKMVG